MKIMSNSIASALTLSIRAAWFEPESAQTQQYIWQIQKPETDEYKSELKEKDKQRRARTWQLNGSITGSKTG